MHSAGWRRLGFTMIEVMVVMGIIAIFAAMIVALPFMADVLQSYMARLAAKIVAG